MKQRITLLVGLLLLAWTAQAQWEPINPGAGGQVQDIVPDPNTPGRLFLASDMEGIYETTDNGLSWEIGADLIHNRVYTVAVAPGSGNVYAGTLYGLEVSTDGGQTFDLVEKSRRKSIGAIAVDPNNPDVVLAGLGWDDDYGFIGTDYFNLATEGDGEVYRSDDGGESWEKVLFGEGTGGERNVYTIRFDESNGQNVYLGSAKGVYKSTDGGVSWDKVEGPAGTANNRGVALSPDGKVLYAAYSLGIEDQERISAIYATPTASVNWQSVIDGVGERDFWYPEVDPRSTGSTHKLISGLQGSRPGLFEATFNWNGNTLSSYSWELIWKGLTDYDIDYDVGWDYADPNPRFGAHYTPATWPRAIWSTTNQTMFQGVDNGSGYTWNNRYSVPNEAFEVPALGETFPTYSSRGTESTYSYDIAVDKNYVIQGQGDNGFMESWDGGKSWSNMQHRTNTSPFENKANQPLSDVQAVDIGQDDKGVPIVIAQAANAYGGFDFTNPFGLVNGNVYAKRLDTYSPQDEWVFIAGGPDFKNGVGGPGRVIRDIAVSPADPKRAFLFTTDNGTEPDFTHGMAIMTDIGWAVAQADQGRDGAWNANISNGIADKAGIVKKIAPHPSNEDIVYFNSTGGEETGVFKGEKTGPNVDESSSWTWTKLYDGSGGDSEVSVWEDNGQLYMFFFGRTTEEGGDGTNYVGSLSLDGGETWTVVLNKEIAMSLRTNEWYDEIKNDFKFESKGGVAGYDDQIIISYYDHQMQKAYGIYRGTIDGSGNVDWKDWTDGLHFGGLTSSIVREVDGQRYLYSTTAGAGAWRRPVEDSDNPEPPTPVALQAPSNLSATAVSDTQIKLTWQDNSGNETGFWIEQQRSDGWYKVGENLGPNVETYTDTGLTPATEYTYRVGTFNDEKVSDYSNEVTVTTQASSGDPNPQPDPEPDPNPCASTNLISNGEFDQGTNGWNFYRSMDGGHSATTVTDAGLSGSNAVYLNIKSATAGASDSDIQLTTPVGALVSGKTYEVVFRAKATGSSYHAGRCDTRGQLPGRDGHADHDRSDLRAGIYHERER